MAVSSGSSGQTLGAEAGTPLTERGHFVPPPPTPGPKCPAFAGTEFLLSKKCRDEGSFYSNDSQGAPGSSWGANGRRSEWCGRPGHPHAGPVSPLASGPGESHPRALTEPYVTVSRHTAPTGRLEVSGSNHQWAKSPGWRCRAAISQAPAVWGLPRSRLYLCMAHR